MTIKDLKAENSRNTLTVISVILLLLILLSFFPAPGITAEKAISISADNLEYLSRTDTYIAKGSVKIIYEDSILTADEIFLNNATSDALATGNVVFEDADVIIQADKIELNLDTRLGTIYNSNIFYKRDNYHIDGGVLKKVGDKIYYMDQATVTTCDAEPPEWHFKGEDIEINLEEDIKAKNTTFYIKDTPVLYSPYFWTPLVKKRKTGFLTPSMGYSNTKGFTFKQGFFWAMKENMDASFYADYYSKKGLGKGLDYRYILNPETNGEFWIYHLKDTEVSRDFLEFKSYHNQKLPGNMSGYLKVHLVNEFDYYNELKSTSFNRFGLSSWKSEPFGFASEERLQKYLESNLHISNAFTGGRAYFLGQYRRSIEGSSGNVPQSLPEVGFIINTLGAGVASFNLGITGTNFWRDENQRGQRLDINPNFFLSLGRTVNFTQKVGLRETLYFLDKPEENFSREIFELRSVLSTRLLRNYSSMIHLIEPSIEYAYTPAVDQSELPTFDSIDSIPQTSDIIYSFTNRFAGSLLGNSEARFRLSQSYSLLDVDRPFSPIILESTFASKNLIFSANAFYNVYDRNISETIASINLSGEKGYIGVGKNFRRSTSLDQYTFEGGLNSPIEILGAHLPVSIYGKLWYDLKGGGFQESIIKSTYTSQCWGLTVSFSNKPHEYELMFGIEFKGLGLITLGKIEDFNQ